MGSPKSTSTYPLRTRNHALTPRSSSYVKCMLESDLDSRRRLYGADVVASAVDDIKITLAVWLNRETPATYVVSEKVSTNPFDLGVRNSSRPSSSSRRSYSTNSRRRPIRICVANFVRDNCGQFHVC